MKKIIAVLLLLTFSTLMDAQQKSVVDQAVEGGKVLVELIKVIGGDKQDGVDPGCGGQHADLCITNARDSSLTVALTHRTSEGIRELIIVPGGRECSLHLALGVWTYDLKLRGTIGSLRKGDLLIEACEDLEMTVTIQSNKN
jgi:hypothetical protein